MNWSQFRTILWLRWRLSRNQLVRAGEVSRVLTMILLVFAALLSLGGGIAGVLLGAFTAGKLAPNVLMLVWDGFTVGFLFFWLLGLMAELQRAESIDLTRLMHLPVSLQQVFIFNYLASHLTVSLLVMGPAMLGFAFGLVWGRSVLMLLLPFIVVSFFFMITAWTYCLRGWLASVMANQRRRRTILVAMGMSMMLLGQLPNLYFNVLRSKEPRRHRDSATPEQRAAARQQKDAENAQFVATVERFHPYVPLLWLPDSARHLAAGRPWVALLEGAACAGLGVLGLRRAYRTTLRYYLGDYGARPVATNNLNANAAGPATAALMPAHPDSASASRSVGDLRGKPGRRSLLELQLPWIPGEAASIALATFRSLSRAPEVKMAFGMPLLATIVLGVIFFGRARANLPEVAKPFVASGVVAMLWFLLFQFFSNQFGYDRHSFRTLVLSASDRRLLLFGKNLAAAPLVLGMGLLLLSVGTVLARLPVLDVFAAAFQLLTMFAILCQAGNCLSIIAPYRVQAGSMKAAKVPVKALLLGLAGTALLPLLLLPIYLAPLAALVWQVAGGSPLVPVNLLLSMLMAGVTLLLYRVVLNPLGRLLQTREKDILEAVSSELE
jgi:hypothetical protein